MAKLKVTDLELKNCDEIVEFYNTQKGNVVSLLQNIQEKFGYLPSHVLYYMSEKLKIPIAKIYGVATFYAQFKFKPRGKYVITICDGTACHVKGATMLEEMCHNELGINAGETTPDLLFSLEKVACLGCCAIAPVAFINKDVHGSLTVAKFRNIINKYKKESAQK